MLASVAAVLPLPLVPAMRIPGKARWGSPRGAWRARLALTRGRGRRGGRPLRRRTCGYFRRCRGDWWEWTGGMTVTVTPFGGQADGASVRRMTRRWDVELDAGKP